MTAFSKIHYHPPGEVENLQVTTDAGNTSDNRINITGDNDTTPITTGLTLGYDPIADVAQIYLNTDPRIGIRADGITDFYFGASDFLALNPAGSEITTTLAGLPAVDPNDFVTLAQIANLVPNSRTITINGVTQDLTADRTWTITEVDPIYTQQGTGQALVLTPPAPVVYMGRHTMTFTYTAGSNISSTYYPRGGMYNELLTTAGLGLSTPFRGAEFFNVLTFNNGARSNGGINYLAGMPSGTAIPTQLILGNDQLGWRSEGTGADGWSTEGIKWAVPDARTITINGITQDLTTNRTWTIPAGTGTVTNFSAGTLSPLFTTSVTNPTTTPNLTFNLQNAGANTWFGNATGGSTLPTYNALSALTSVNDTNITLTLGGTPTTALAKAVSMTLGWTGQLAVSRGGTGASTLTGVVIGNGTSAMTAVAGTANQMLRRNAANTAYEFFTPNFGTVLSVGANITGTAVSIAGSPITTSGTLDFSWTGTTAQYVRGDGTLATFPTIPTTPNLQQVNTVGNTTTIPIAKLGPGGQGISLIEPHQREFFGNTGAIAIKHTPVNNTTFRLRVSLYSYNTGLIIYDIAFLRTTGALSGALAIINYHNNLPSNLVRISHDGGGNLTILLGDVTTNWGASVMDVNVELISTNWTGGEDASFYTGWTVVNETDLSAYGTIVTANTKIIGTGTGTVTSVGITGSGALSFTGSPVTTSGTFTTVWGGTTAQYVRGDGTLATLPAGGSVTSVGLSMPAAFSVSGSPVTTSGTLTVTGAGTTSEYIRGDGTLATFPTIPTYTGSTSIILSGSSFQRAALTGDVTAAANSNATTIANNAVTYAKMQDIATQTLIGRGAAGTGDPGAVTIGAGLSLSAGNVLSSTITDTNLASTNLTQTAAVNRTYDMNTNDLTFFNGQFTLGQVGEYGALHLYEQAAADAVRVAVDDHQFYIQYTGDPNPIFMLDFNDVSLMVSHFDLSRGFTFSGSGVSDYRTYSTPDYNGEIELKETTTQLLTGSATMTAGVKNIIRYDNSATNFTLSLLDPAINQNRTVIVTNANAGNGTIAFGGSFVPMMNPTTPQAALTAGQGTTSVAIKSINISGTWTWIVTQS